MTRYGVIKLRYKFADGNAVTFTLGELLSPVGRKLLSQFVERHGKPEIDAK